MKLKIVDLQFSFESYGDNFSRSWLMIKAFRASSYDPGWPGWPGFRDLSTRLNPSQKFWTFISVFQPRSRQPGWKFFHMSTPFRLPGQNVFDKIALLLQQSRQNGIISPCMYFLFISMRIIFVTKVTGVDKATVVANDTMLLVPICFCFSNFYLGRPGWNFSYEQKTKFVLVTESARLTRLIRRCP